MRLNRNWREWAVIDLEVVTCDKQEQGAKQAGASMTILTFLPYFPFYKSTQLYQTAPTQRACVTVSFVPASWRWACLWGLVFAAACGVVASLSLLEEQARSISPRAGTGGAQASRTKSKRTACIRLVPLVAPFWGPTGACVGSVKGSKRQAAPPSLEWCCDDDARSRPPLPPSPPHTHLQARQAHASQVAGCCGPRRCTCCFAFCALLLLSLLASLLPSSFSSLPR